MENKIRGDDSESRDVDERQRRTIQARERIKKFAKRGRGRPRKDEELSGGNRDTTVGEIAEIGGLDSDDRSGGDGGDRGNGSEERNGTSGSEERGKRGRGRPRKDGKEKEKTSIDRINKTALFLKNTHRLAGTFSNLPSIQISDAEAIALAQSLDEVLIAYDLVGTGKMLDPKITTPISLMMTAAFVYGPRIPQIQEEMRYNKAKKTEGKRT